MADNFHGCLAFILKAEGGWSDNPLDPGGCTMRGITLESFQEWRHNPYLTCAELKAISILDVTGFYHDLYWVPMHGDDLPSGVDLMVIDSGVNVGMTRGAKLLQEQVGVATDGVIGAATLTAVLRIEPAILIDSLATAQTAYYETLPQFSVFGEGWLNRVRARHTAALAMISTS